MATCTLTLYKILYFDSSKRFKIEGIETFLDFEQQASETFLIQYQKLNLSMNIKLNIPQANIVGDFGYNYAKIHYDTEEKDFYFFIENYQWIAMSTIEVTLVLDVLNSINFEFDKRTQILREHRNTLTDFSYDPSTNVVSTKRLIDTHTEGLNLPLFRRAELTPLTLAPKSTSNLAFNVNQNWYLIYRTTTTPDTENPESIYDCFLCADRPIKIYDAEGIVSPIVYTPQTISQGNYFFYADPGDGDVTVSYTLSGGTKVEATLTAEDEDFVTIERVSKTEFNVWYYSRNELMAAKSGKCETFTIVSGSYGHYSTSPRRKDYDNIVNLPNKWYWNANTENEYIIQGIEDVDRTDTRLIKIIEIPYQPLELITYGLPSNRVYQIGDQDKDYFYFSREMQMLRFAYPWKTISKTYYAGGSLLSPLKTTSTLKEKPYYDNEGKNDFYESKLYHSDFYEQALVYDSFRWVLDLEKVDITNIPSSIEVDFHFTNTINSRFLFNFNIDFNKELTEDFANVLSVSRNNELPLLNSVYLDYVRNGYNYDVKAKQRKEFNIIARAGLAIGSAVGNTSGLALVGTALSTITAIQELGQAEDTIKQRLEQNASRSVSVSTADAYDLMNVYAKNRLLYGVYELSESAKNLVSDLFYYFGYSINENGIPNTTSRTQFNYVQCNAVFKNEGLMKSDFRERLRDLFSLGVTYIHHYQNHVGDYVYDLEQISANRQKDFDDFLKGLE